MTITTRSGRAVKKPDRYEPPAEKLLDDYNDSEYEHDTDDDDDIDSIQSDDDVSESGSDVDENGNLQGFVESDSEEDED